MSAVTRLKSPYKGLMPYSDSEDDAQFFFGREAETEVITANLRVYRLTILYGASGVGKSSLLNAGVAYHLRQLARKNLDEHGASEFAVVVFNSWRDDPIAGLLKCVQDSAAQALSDQSLLVLPSSGNLVEALEGWAARLNGDLLIILDQFEEYFLYHNKEDGEGTFATEFPRAVNRTGLRVNFLVSIREDSVAKLDHFKGRMPNPFANSLRVKHLDRKAARAAIGNPIVHFNNLPDTHIKMSIDPKLADIVIDQIKTGQVFIGEVGLGGKKLPSKEIEEQPEAEVEVETPYLQLVMNRLWEEEIRAKPRTLRVETLIRLGLAEKIVKTHLDAVMNYLPTEEQEIAARVFRYLVTAAGSKFAYTIPELAELESLLEAPLEAVLIKLSGSHRILRTIDPSPHQPTLQRYEIFHDVLAPAILDWRARFLRGKERAEAKRQLSVERRRITNLMLIPAVVLLLLGFFLSVWSYRENWFGVRATYLANRNANPMDVVDWLVNIKFRGNIDWGNFSSDSTKKALVALGLAYELDSTSNRGREVKDYLEKILIPQRKEIQRASALSEELESYIKILEEIHRYVPHAQLLAEAESLKPRAERLRNIAAARAQLIVLNQQWGDSIVRNDTLLNRYQALWNNFQAYLDATDSDTVTRKIARLERLTTQFNQLVGMQAGGTVTLGQQREAWKGFINSASRTSPEIAYAVNDTLRLWNWRAQMAWIDGLECDGRKKFLTCRNVVNLQPQGISDSFQAGASVHVWACVWAPQQERVTFKWYVSGQFDRALILPVGQNTNCCYRIWANRVYGANARGKDNEVRLYNSQNHLIGRQVFEIR